MICHFLLPSLSSGFENECYSYLGRKPRTTYCRCCRGYAASACLYNLKKHTSRSVGNRSSCSCLCTILKFNSRYMYRPTLNQKHKFIFLKKNQLDPCRLEAVENDPNFKMYYNVTRQELFDTIQLYTISLRSPYTGPAMRNKSKQWNAKGGVVPTRFQIAIDLHRPSRKSSIRYKDAVAQKV